MTSPDLPLWGSILISFCLLAGASITLLGAVGLFRFTNFFDRSHSTTLCSSLGTFLTLLASILFFSITRQRLVIHEVLIMAFIIVTTPVTLMMLGRAAFFRYKVFEKLFFKSSVKTDALTEKKPDEQENSKNSQEE